MTDSEIIKALECCRDNDNNLNMDKCFDECPYKGECTGKFMQDALSLITRQKEDIDIFNSRISVRDKLLEKAESEIKMLEKCCDNLESEIERMDYDMDLLKQEIRVIKSEARREFAEAVKMKFYYHFDEMIPSIMADEIDNLLKEMESESDAE